MILPVNQEPRNPSSSELISTKVPALKMDEEAEEAADLDLDLDLGAIENGIRVSSDVITEMEKVVFV